ncbi:hypothetical protein VTL71DRAFT_4775 [Oculimacula yallundae]|uniref:KANL3/Tex30 alpha/beta hydrolase-like domain-containing protein n=1 Tax=Oculimacula yallundae TaxID=86028 RepID=A0ABR4C438_9HELO
MGFLNIGKPEVQAGMRIPPQLPIERIDSSIQTSSNHHTHCRLYHTSNLPASIVEHPGGPPLPPSAVRPLRPKTKSDSDRSRASLVRHYNTRIAQYNLALEAFKAQKLIWEAKYADYVESLNLESIAAVVDDDDVVQEARSALRKESAQTDIIAAAKPLVVFTHGRNSTLEDQHITAFCQGFAREAATLLFEDTRPELQRIHVFRTLADNYPSIKAFPGRSAGARNAAKASIHTAAKRLIFFTYPLVRDLNYRYTDLLALGSDIEVLFVVGDGDPLAVETHLREIRHRMRAKSWWIKLIKGDHSFKQWTLEEMQNTLDIAGQLAAIWAKEENLDPDLSELVLRSSFDTGKAEWTSWQAPEPGTPKPGAFFTVSAEGGDFPGGGASFQFSVPPSESRWRGNKGK